MQSTAFLNQFFIFFIQVASDRVTGLVATIYYTVYFTISMTAIYIVLIFFRLTIFQIFSQNNFFT